MSVTAGEKYRLKEPKWSKTIGQGDPPSGVTITRTLASGEQLTYELPWGTVYKASSNCDPDGEVANLDAPTPLLRTDIIEEMGTGEDGQFELVSAPADEG